MRNSEDSPALVSIVAPFYNESAVAERFLSELTATLSNPELRCRFELILVDDGSRDDTLDRIRQKTAECLFPTHILQLSRNFGHSSAVTAGLLHTTGDAVILMDSDLQDDPAAIPELIEKWREGNDVVYAIRSSRGESAILRLLFWCFYRILATVAMISLPSDAGNFGIMDRKVVDQLKSLPEQNRYFPGLRAWVGFSQTGIQIPRRVRTGSDVKVGLRGKWKLAMNALFSFSYVPLFFFRFLGALAMLFAAGMMCFALYHKFFTGLAIPMWTSIVCAVSLFGGLNIFGIGIVGEYVARIYDEVKGRPPFVIRGSFKSGPSA